MIWSFLFAHVLVDFVLQSKETAENKLNLKKTFNHSLWIFVVTLIILLLSGFLDWKVIFLVLVVAVTHGTIDFFKAKLEIKINCKWKWLLFVGDQVLHVTIILLGIIVVYPNLGIAYLSLLLDLISKINIVKFMFFFVIITFGGSLMISIICQPFLEKNNKKNTFIISGKYIGILERIIISASILIGRFEIIGFLIAAKLIRHQDKENVADYFLIGTFTSFIWAAVFTFLFLKL